MLISSSFSKRDCKTQEAGITPFGIPLRNLACSNMGPQSLLVVPTYSYYLKSHGHQGGSTKSWAQLSRFFPLRGLGLNWAFIPGQAKQLSNREAGMSVCFWPGGVTGQWLASPFLGWLVSWSPTLTNSFPKRLHLEIHTFVLGPEAPVLRPSPQWHGTGAEIGIFSRLHREKGAHGLDVSIPEGDHFFPVIHKSMFSHVQPCPYCYVQACIYM